MKKPALTLLAVVLPIAALLALWFTLDESGRGGRGAGSEHAREHAPIAPPAVELAEPVQAPDASPVPEPITTPTVRDGERQSVASNGSGRRIAGRILPPDGTPADDSLRVLALSEPVSPREIYGDSGLLADLAKGRKTGRLLGTAPVSADGRFELALGVPDEVWLAIDGRFLYSSRPEPVPVAAQASIELPAELGGCLAGSVRLPASAGVPVAGVEDRTEQPFEGIDLELGPDGQNFSMSSLGTTPLFRRGAEVDAQGRFELRALPPEHAHELEVESDAYATTKVNGLVFEPGRVREIELQLQRGATLRGSVRDEHGAPLAAAEVAAVESAMWGFPGGELSATRTDAAGDFVLARIAPGKCLVIAKQEGFLDSQPAKLELFDEEQRDGLRLELGRGGSIAGTVRTADDAPVEGAEIRVSFDPEALVGMGAFNAARGAEGQATSTVGGLFEVTGLGKGPFLVRATRKQEAADGFEETWLAKASSVKPDTRDLALTLQAPQALHGRVRDMTGAPVVQFELSATQDGGAFFVPGQTRREPCEDPEGAFVLRGLEAGKWSILAGAEGFGPMTALEIQIPRTEANPLELVLAPAATISGTVVDPRGAPVVGARITQQADTAQRFQRMRGEAKAPETSSGEDGSFLLTGLGAGTNTIYAGMDDFAPSEPASVETSAEHPATGVRLVLRKGGVITGEVYGADGKPAGNTQVVGQCSSTLDTHMKRTDGAGAFRFEHLTPGAWTVTAILEGATMDAEGSAAEGGAAFLENMRFTMVQLEDGAEQHVVLGAPPKDPVLVRGRVHHGDRPVEQGLVSFVGEGAKGLEAMRMAPLGADGRFQTQLDAPGPYVVTVQVTVSGTFQQNNVELRETIPAVEVHELELSLPLGSLRGRVLGANHEPLGGARVTLATEGGIEAGSLLGGHYSETTTDDAGHYAFEYLRPGAYAVAAGGALFGGAFGAPSLAGRRVRSGLEVEEGRALEGVDFQLDEPGDIKGRVVDHAGAPIRDAAVFVRDSGGHLLDRFSMITSGADGGFTYSGVAPGEYLVSARGKGLASPDSAPVRVERGGTASVELVLYAGTKLEIEVVDEEGEAIRARVSVLDRQGREMQGMLGWSEMVAGFSEGLGSNRQSIGPLPPGSYTVAASADGKTANKPVTLDGQPERRLKLRLR